MSKRAQEDTGEERVTAKSKPMMSLVSRYSVRDPNLLASTASESLVKTKSESQNVLLSSLFVQQISTLRPVLGASSSNYSEWNIDDKWSSQVRKSGEMLGASSWRLVDDKFVIDDDMDSDTATESSLSQRSRSFLNRVNDRLRKMLDRSPEDSMQDIDKRSMIWWMFTSSTLEASVFMRKNYSENDIPSKNTGKDLSLKQMFDISEKLIVEQSDEIFGVSQISWENSPWKQLSLVNDEEFISLSHAKVCLFWDSVLCLGKVNHNPATNTTWEEQLSWCKDSSPYRTLDTIDGEPLEFEWNIFPGFTTLQLINKVHEFMSKMCDSSEFKGRIFIIWGSEDNEEECIAHATLVTLFAKRFPPGRWSFLGPGSEKKWYSTYIDKTTRRMGQSRWIDDDSIQRKRTPSFPSHESIVPRNAQKQRRWKIIDTLLCRWWYDWNCFSHNYLS